MGVVWKAEDTTLNREVAIKILPPQVAQDIERLARFDREAKLLASLNHANIASVFGLHTEGEVRFLSMEFVEGEDLSKRLARGRMSLEESLGIARQVADALQSAHERGIVHRDLKPANIVLAPDGTPKVLDFGLAKALEADPSAPANPTMSPTLTSAGTVAGMILGTAGYMSPEQARGSAADKRADVWAFGVVLYEMLCGTRTFHGDTVSDTLASVLKLEPDWNRLPGDLPRGIRRLLRRCLQKDPRQRLHDIADARIEIDEALAAPHEEAETGEVTVTRPARTRWALTLVLVALGVIVGLAAGRNLLTSAPESPVRRFFIPVAAAEGQPRLEGVTLSPDGKHIAYTFDGKLWLRDLDKVDPRPIEGSEGAREPFWSPDGAHVAYVTDGKLWRVASTGGQPTMISEVGKGRQDPTWPTEETIATNTGTELKELSARGGESTMLLEIESGETDFHNLSHLPGGELLFVVHRSKGPDTLAMLKDGERKGILQIEDAWLGQPVYSKTGHILFSRKRRHVGIWAVPFSLSSFEATGDPFLVVPGGVNASVAEDGTLVHEDAFARSETEMIWVSMAGEVEETVGQSQSGIFVPAVSPDGTRIAVSGEENDEWNIWVHDVVRKTKTPLTFSETIEGGPHWSADGETIFYFSPVFGEPKTIYRLSADGSGDPEKVMAGGAPRFSADTTWMIFERRGDDTKRDLWAYSLDDGSEPTVFLQTEADEFAGELSPDGRFAAYVSDESGGNQVYVKPFPTGAGRWQVSVDGGNWPSFSPSGDRLFFQSDGKLMQVSFTASPRVLLGNPELVVNPAVTRHHPFRGYDIAPDGERFVFIRPVPKADEEEETVDGIFVVENWLAEFRD
jgi:Tol biopolymer transport system component